MRDTARTAGRRGRGRLSRLLLLLSALALLAGCYHQQMADQPSRQPLEASDFFPDGRASRTPVEGTVPRGELRHDEPFHTGKIDGEPAEAFPFPVTREVLERGRERYDIFCSPCHDRVGTGEGMVVRRGFRRPASFHSERLRQQPPGYFVDVMTAGFGVMPSYAAQVPPRDRWAIAAYIRALQLSQRASPGDVPQGERERLGLAAPDAETGDEGR